MEQGLREALEKLLGAAADKDREAIAPALARVTELQRRLGSDAPEMLRHYLERRSYQKALDFLNSGRPDTSKPRCGL